MTPDQDPSEVNSIPNADSDDSDANQDPDDTGSNPNVEDEPTLDEIIAQRLSRRTFVSFAGGVLAGGATVFASQQLIQKNAESVSDSTSEMPAVAPQKTNGSFNFIEIEHGSDENHHVAPDHTADILVRWGDPIFVGAPEFDPYHQTAEAQKQQFGYNNDYIGYLPLEPYGDQQARALLCVNHEYPINGLMFQGLGDDIEAEITPEQIDIAKAAIGNSIVEVVLENNKWAVNIASPFNRRISALDTNIQITGPAAGHPRLRTHADKTGRTVIGTLNNCAGGMTPWGTYLSCEENFNYHFRGTLPEEHRENSNHARYNVPSDLFLWGKHDQRFDVEYEPNEPNRFGWVVEIDPMNPDSVPKKRTALGRLKHEGAKNVIAPDGRLVIYMGDDQRFDYLYKFVSRDPVNLSEKSANIDLLDHGTLYVAKFFANGSLTWLPIEYGNGPLAAPAFGSQGEVLIETRIAADLLGATPMDRPEDVIPNPQNGRVYVMLTNNSRRKETSVANPRINNLFGHIVEIIEPNGDFTSEHSNWSIMLRCGDPSNPEHDSLWHPDISEHGWFASPDNGVIDPSGRLWVSTDQGGNAKLSGTDDGLWALETKEDVRGMGRMFFRCPVGAEMCGPQFSDDGKTLFVAVQHPGDSEKASEARVETTRTRWPDFEVNKPPRPSIVVIQKKNGGEVG